MYSPKVATVTTVTLNVRDGAGTQAVVIGQTRQGDPVLLFGEPVVTEYVK